MTADTVPDGRAANGLPPFESITTREAVALLERVRVAYESIAATIASLELFVAELPEDGGPRGWLRGEIEEAVQELDVAAGLYLSPDMENERSSITWLTRRIAAADGQVLP